MGGREGGGRKGGKVWESKREGEREGGGRVWESKREGVRKEGGGEGGAPYPSHLSPFSSTLHRCFSSIPRAS